MGRSIWGALFLVLAGCGGNGRLLHGDTRFSAEQRAELESVAERWESFSGEPIAIVWDGPRDGDNLIYGDGPFAGEPLVVGSGGPHGVYLDPSRIPASRQGGLTESAMHEFGHYLGLMHVRDERAIMFSYWHPASAFTEADLAECHRVGLCDGTRLEHSAKTE